MLDGLFRLVDPPAGQTQVIEDVLAAIDYPWVRLEPALRRDPDGAVLVLWDDLGQRGTGVFYGHTIEIHLSTRYVGWQDKVPFVFAHEVGHLVDKATLTSDDQAELLALFHDSPATYRRDDTSRSDAHARDHYEKWSAGQPHYYLNAHESFADLFVRTFARALWEGRTPRFTHWTDDLDTFRRIVVPRDPRRPYVTRWQAWRWSGTDLSFPEWNSRQKERR